MQHEEGLSMNPAPLTPDEPARLEALRGLGILDTPLEERFERITRLAKRTLGVEIAAVSLVESDRQWFKSIQGLDVEQTGRDESFCAHAIHGSSVMVVPDAREDGRFRENPLVTGPPHIVFYAGCPVRASDGSCVGTLCVIDSRPQSFGADDAGVLEDLAGLVESELRSSASAATQAYLVEEMAAEQRRAKVDGLTRVWNRDGILEVAGEALESARRGDSGAALVVVDLDGFKGVNDTYGHAAGDEVLRSCARRMLSTIREGDAVGRLGGDEFLLVVWPCECEDAAAAIVERVRARVASVSVRAGEDPVPISASFGVRYLAAGADDDLEALLESADHAMYESKRGGRNRVCVSARERAGA